ncbi:MAG: glycosyltransferase family A protein [Nakamurella sp.]
MQGEPPHFSIVIPAFNEESYLGDCLSSLSGQDYPGSFEVIVVDNNSTDHTAAVACAAGATVVFEPIPGVCRARQRGTEIAAGEIIVSADADCIYQTGWLSHIAQWFLENPEGIAVGGPCYFYDGPRWGLAVQRMLFGAVTWVQRRGGPVVYVTATNFAFRSCAFTGYDVRLSQGGDELDLLRRLKRYGHVAFDSANFTYTSARRMEQGVVYNFAVSFFYYYILGYALNRFLRRPVLGMAPAFRHSPDYRPGVGVPLGDSGSPPGLRF